MNQVHGLFRSTGYQPVPRNEKHGQGCPCCVFAFILLLCAQGLAADQPISLTAPNLSITLDPAKHGAVTSLMIAGQQFIGEQKYPRLFSLDLSRRDNPSKRLYITSRDAASCQSTVSTSAGKTTAKLIFRGPPSQPVEVTCTITAAADDPLLRFRLSLRLPDDLMLDNVRYPVLGLRAPLQGDSDALVVGNAKGGIYRRPSSFKTGHYISANQPGSLAAAFGSYYAENAGLLTAALDPRGYPKSISFSRTAEGIDHAWVHACYARGSYSIDYDTVLGAVMKKSPDRPLDWRDAADIYKKWALAQPWCARTFAQRDDLPAWLKSGPAMVRFNRAWLATPDRIAQWLDKYWKPNFPAAPLIIAYWGWEKVDSWISPDYFPCYPSDEVFKKLTALGRQYHGHSFLWPSGYHYTLTHDKQPDGTFAWDDRARFDKEIRPHAIVTRDGATYARDCSWLRGGQNSAVCPGDPWTIDWFNNIGKEILGRGADMVQVDQVVGGNFPPCYSTTHKHPPGPGSWMTEVFTTQLKTLLATCQKTDRDAVVGFEEPNERFNHLVGIQDYRDTESKATERASVFNYLYHEFLPTFQSNPHPDDRLQTAWCIVTGQIPHLVPSMNIIPGPLLANGGFEEVAGNGFPEAWEHVKGYAGKVFSGQASLDTAQFHGGKQGLHLVNTEKDQQVQVSRNIPIGPTFKIGSTYRLSCWIKSAGAQQQSAIGLGALAPGLKSVGHWRIPLPKEPGEWSRGSTQFTLPPGAQVLRIMIHVTGPARLWVDDFLLEEITSDGRDSEVMRPSKPLDHELMRQWVELFHGPGRPYLLNGKMLHPPRLKITTASASVPAAVDQAAPAILHNAFESSEGSQAAILVNATDAAQAAELIWPGEKPAPVKLNPWQVLLLPH